ncbi:MAG: polymer-forming cytoskeletal protein [Bacillota bacterium]|nr:polymer-forming cytoskeletal protein [Bacillota bacterium]
MGANAIETLQKALKKNPSSCDIPENAQETVCKPKESEDISIISKDTVINGSLMNQTNIIVNGRVNGNIICRANIFITGVIEGDITADSVTIRKGRVTGNIISEKTVNISEEAMIEGDIKCDVLYLDGNLKGNACAVTSASLGKASSIQGNLNSQFISVKEGAVLSGEIRIDRNKDIKVEIESFMETELSDCTA